MMGAVPVNHTSEDNKWLLRSTQEQFTQIRIKRDTNLPRFLAHGRSASNKRRIGGGQRDASAFRLIQKMRKNERIRMA
jgi:hypothetical protein